MSFQKSFPFIFMRGGSSRGPYFNKKDLPSDRDELSEVLISVLGSGQFLNIDGIGGGNAVTTKVAILSQSDDDWADVDYFFAQVSVLDKTVDYRPTCGNILAGVGPAAVEMGLVKIAGDLTEVKIKAVNTGARVISKVKTDLGAVNYFGDCQIDGVPGTSSPIQLLFLDVAGSSTGKLFPTGSATDVIRGVEVTCMDLAMPMVIARASSFGLTGSESVEELESNRAFFESMEAIRVEAGQRMGMGDVSESVTPKFGLVAQASEVGHMICRYFMPWQTHPSLAVTGSQCLASCALAPGTVAYDLMKTPENCPATIILHHPMGTMEVLVDFEITANNQFVHKSAGLTRTARKLASGEVFAHIPSN